MFQYVAVLVGDSALQLCIIVERLILGDYNDLVVRAFILVHSLLLMSSFTFDICIMWMFICMKIWATCIHFIFIWKKCQRNACNACALTIYGQGTTFFERFISSIQVMILPSVGVAITLHGCYIYTCMGVQEHHKGVWVHPKGSLVFMAVRTPLKV